MISESIFTSKWVKISKITKNTDIEQLEIAFVKFASLWIAFNSLYYLEKAKPNSDERILVKDFIRTPMYAFQVKHIKLLAEDPDYLAAIQIFRDRKDGIRKKGSYLKIRNHNDAVDIIEFVYQIRCNLFHGYKLPVDHIDHNLLTSAYTVLDKLIFSQIST